MKMFILLLILLLIFLISIEYANSFHNNNYYCYTRINNYMKRMSMKRMSDDDKDDNDNIKYIHKPLIVKDTDPLVLIGK